MGSYTVIADAGKTIVELLRREMLPEPIRRGEEIGLCSPDNMGECILGLYLYDIEEIPESRNNEKIMLDREHYKNPPTSLNLYYMLFVRSSSESSAKSTDEHLILGRAVQAINDYSRISDDIRQGTIAENDEAIDIQGIVMPFEEKQKIISLFDKKDFTCFFYKAGPVFIESKRIQRVKRVSQAGFIVSQK